MFRYPVALGTGTPDTELGEVPERLNGTVSKTVVVLWATVGSNPTLSAFLSMHAPVGTRKGMVFPSGDDIEYHPLRQNRQNTRRFLVYTACGKISTDRL